MKDAFLHSILRNVEIKPVMKNRADCFLQGQAAYSQAYRRDQNPYPIGTDLREWWDAGWLNDQDELLGT